MNTTTTTTTALNSLGSADRRALRLLATLGSSEWTRLARSTRQNLRLRGLADNRGLTDLGRAAAAQA